MARRGAGTQLGDGGHGRTARRVGQPAEESAGPSGGPLLVALSLSMTLSNRCDACAPQVTAAEAPRPPLYSGWLTKLGAVRKSWKRRWFVVSPDYGMAYYAGSDTRGAPKGEMMLQGYEVRADCFKAEKDLCIELYHQKRRCFYVYANTVEEYEQWIPMLKEVRATVPLSHH